MSSIGDLYDLWSETYDTVRNRTRDLEKISLDWALGYVGKADHCIEIGCGTGKNTTVLLSKSNRVTSVDISPLMLKKANAKIHSDRVSFVCADINREWTFDTTGVDLVTFSLVLGHIENLDHVFAQLSKLLLSGGLVYIGELHPFKIYSGSKAWFDEGDMLFDVPCFRHSISDFVRAALNANLAFVNLNEYFDVDDPNSTLPRILSLIFRKE